MLLRARRVALLAVLLAVAGGAPADAAEVIVVDGDRAVRRDDPLVPSQAEAGLGRPPAGRATARAAHLSARGSTVRGRRAVGSALRRALRGGGISRGRFHRYRRSYTRARSSFRRLRGARRIQLGYLIASLERMGLRRRLIASRLPALFLQLERNTQYWRSFPYPRAGDQVTFRGSEILFQYYPGRGLQIQPLVTFKKANNMHGACTKPTGVPCLQDGLRRLLDEMAALAVERSRSFIAWEYLFDFGGGSPPWISGMAESTAVQAYARGAQLLGRPDWVTLAQRALGAFETHAPVGVRTTGFRGGPHYLQYSFAPRLFIFNAFVQAVIGLYDFNLLTGDERAGRLFDEAEPELRREIPFSDTGSWSRYSYRGARSTGEYHELLRELLQSACSRGLGDVYCTYAARYRRYQTR
jgi:D-glucuronyl C5-epimerase C-terminus